MSSLPAAVQAADIATSRLRNHVLSSGPGDAPALVLVHGNVSSARFFAETMAALGESWHCIAADLRGFGGSQRVPIDARSGLREFAADLHAPRGHQPVRPGAQALRGRRGRAGRRDA